jgi:chromosome segregation ATPase
MHKGFLKLSLLAASLAAASHHPAYADATTEAQLRAALQTATSQIATLEDQVANLQASQAPDVAMIEALRAQLKTSQAGGAPAGTTETSAEKAKTAAALAALNRQLAAGNAALGKSQTAYQAAAAQNAALKAQLATLNTGLTSCTAKNAQLYKIGNQILDAYSHKDDVFSAFANHEPFIGFKRVQLQNIVQDEQDKLDSNQINPAGSNP